MLYARLAAEPAPEANRDPQRRRLFRRITVAPGGRLRTAVERLSMLDIAILDPDLLGVAPLAIQARCDEAFDVEAVTRRFYRQYRDLFEQVEGAIESFGDDADRKRLFTQRLFNRLMFIAFIQKKGWLRFGGDTDYLDALWGDYALSPSS